MPDRRHKVVVNTTPLIALSLTGNLSLLARLYGQVNVPPAVLSEIFAGGSARIGVKDVEQADWLRRIALSDPGRADLLADLDRGEAEAIALAQEIGADLLIVDERLARWHARRLGLTITGTLGVLLRAKEQDLISEIHPIIEQMQAGGIRLGDQLVARVLDMAGE